MQLHSQSTKSLSNGIEMPRLGLGVYKMTDRAEALNAIEHALKTGYRHIDTASLYENEKEVGEAVRASGISREEIFVTTKVWNSDQGYDQTLRAFEKSLKLLDMEYLDLYLTHWPVADTFVDTYRAIERLYEEKLIRATGVSNHHEQHLQQLIDQCSVPPMVNQIECHPRLAQFELRDFCKAQGIAVTSWSPLSRGKLLDESSLITIAEKYGKSTAQVIIRWHLQGDLIVIPKSVKAHRIEENANVYDFELTAEDMRIIDALNRNERVGKDPDNFHFDF